IGSMPITRHSLAQPVRHEPGRLVGHLQRAVQLVAADALLTRCEQVGRLEPFVQRHLAVLEYSADLAGELLLAVAAAAQTDPAALYGRDSINATTMRADRAIRPHNGFQPSDGGGLVMEVWIV